MSRLENIGQAYITETINASSSIVYKYNASGREKVILTAIVFCILSGVVLSRYRVLILAPATLGCVAILVSVLGVKVHENRLIARAGIYLGEVSYGLYVWHFLVLLLMLKVLTQAIPFAGDWIGSSVFEAVCALVLTIAISAASYGFLETPFLKLKSRFALIPSRPT